MHERHDLDLIAAFAREALADASPARALIESCPECAEYYRATRLVLEAVRTDPAPRLTDLERYRLHRAIWEEVAPEAPAASPTSRGRAWYRLAGRRRRWRRWSPSAAYSGTVGPPRNRP